MSGENYVEMIEIPVGSCEVVSVPGKKKFSVKGMFSKSKLFGKKKNSVIPEKTEEKTEDNISDNVEKVAIDTPTEDSPARLEAADTVVAVQKKRQKKFKFDFVAAQIAAVFVLVAAILITNVVWADSGMNTLFRKVFGTESSIDNRSHTAFAPLSPVKTGEVTLENGIMKLKKGAVYSPADGTITEIKEENGAYSVTVNHSDVFLTVIKGLDCVYHEKGDKIYTGVPVGTAGEAGAEATMYESGEIVTGYTIENGGIVWQK